MIVNVREIFQGIKSKLDINTALDLSGEECFEDHSFDNPVEVRGSIENRADIIELSLIITAFLKKPCDRCYESAERKMVLDISRILTTEPVKEEQEDYIFIENNRLDLSEFVSGEILLNVPIKHLCREDCKGLCPRCGTNLNINKCNCGN